MVSIIVPSYNHASFLRDCLASAVNQTYTDWELLVIDDGSSDGSLEIARAFASDPRITVTRNEANLGTYGTQQKGLERSNGEFIAVLNSDDMWDPQKLSLQVQALATMPEAAACYVLGWKIDENGEVDRSDDVHEDWPTQSEQELLPWLLYENRILASGVLFRRRGLRFETTCRYSGDWVALLEAAERGPFACVPERLTYWRIHGMNTFRTSPNQAFEEIRVRESIQSEASRWLSGRWRSSEVQSGLCRNAMNLIALYSLFGDRPKARRSALRAMRFGGMNPSVLKRSLATLMPGRILRRRLWPNVPNTKDFPNLAPLLQDIDLIRFR